MKNSKFSMLQSSGSYFICATYEKISDKAAKDLAVELTQSIGVATIPVSAFHVDGAYTSSPFSKHLAHTSEISVVSCDEYRIL